MVTFPGLLNPEKKISNIVLLELPLMHVVKKKKQIFSYFIEQEIDNTSRDKLGKWRS